LLLLSGAAALFVRRQFRRLAARLEERERDLRESQRLAQLGSWNLDLTRNELSWSDEVFRIFEIDPTKFGASYDAFLALVHPEDRDLVNQAYTSSVENRQPYEVTHRLLMPDRRVKTVTERGVTYYAEGSGKALRSIGTVQDVSARVALSSAAEQERDFAERLLETVPAVILVLDNLGRIQRVNGFFEELTGFRREELHGADWFTTMLPAREELRVRAKFADACAGTPMRGNVNAILLRGGGEVEIEWYDHILRDKAGAQIGLLAIGLDITERKQAEAHLRLAASVVDNAAEGIIITDRDNNIISVNWAFTQITGYAADEVIGRNPRLLAAGAQTERFYEEMWASIRTEGRWQGEVWDKRKSGERYCESLSISAVRNEQGEVSHYCGMFADITGRKRAEEALREEEAKLLALYKMPHVGLVLTDIQCRYLEFNEAFRTITGYPDDELRALDSWKLTPGEYQAIDERQLELAKRTGRYGPYEKEYVRKDGSLIPLQLNGSLFTASDGTQYLWTIVEDITERKRLERALLEAADHERRRLGADLHDGLGQQLTGISLMAGALAQAATKGKVPRPEELAQLEVLMRQAIATCRTVARGLSPLSCAGGGLVGALQEMAHPQEGHMYGPEVHFEAVTAAPLRLPPDATDHLYRIAQEAVTNARRHADAQRIDITLDIQPATVRLEIQDDGIGRPPPTVEAIGMGQKIMQFRTASIGARLSVGPGDHGGTLITVECPQPP
jgi:PAS domain S-box-containing protein